MNQTPPIRLALAVAVLSLPVFLPLPALAQALSPDGPGCQGAVSRWQAFAGQENEGGHMSDSVYSKLKTEIDEATAVCRSGQDAQASRMVEASMRRHGY